MQSRCNLETRTLKNAFYPKHGDFQTRGCMGSQVEVLYSWRLPAKALKLPTGHVVQLPANIPPHPLRYWPATHCAAEQAVQSPGGSKETIRLACQWAPKRSSKCTASFNRANSYFIAIDKVKTLMNESSEISMHLATDKVPYYYFRSCDCNNILQHLSNIRIQR